MTRLRHPRSSERHRRELGFAHPLARSSGTQSSPRCAGRVVASLAIAFSLFFGAGVSAQTLGLLPENPRYFSWRGRPLVIVGSGEHYGAVLNADFDFRKYLATLGAEGLNHTRLFTGAAYVEPQGAFNIARNTLAPEGPRFLAPWARSDQPGYAGGGLRFDLSRWDESYFDRLREFVREAGRRKVIVEVTLFCPFYEDSQWRLSPFHPDNNVNGAGRGVERTQVYTLDQHGGLLAIQERFVDRVVAELGSFDNLYYEICNEPYFGGVTLEWQARIARRIAEAQASHREPKLISRNIANNKARVEVPLDPVSIYNFHYATPPDTVALNRHLNRPIGDNETGFRGTQDAPYRMEAWDFLIAGGALFSHLDYSFTVGHEDGRFAYPPTQPGGGNPELRRQFRFLREFIEEFDLARVAPDDSVVVDGVPATHTARALVEPGRRIGVYFRPAGITPFSVRWTGHLEVPVAADHTFHASSNDGMRLWIDDRQVLDRWVEQSATEHAAAVSLTAGRHALRVEYFYNGGQASANLSWSRSGLPKEVVPASVLSQPDGTGPGLRGEYFKGREFNEAWETRVDPQIQFDWGTTPPLARPRPGEPGPLRLSVPAGQWTLEWIDPVTGGVVMKESKTHDGGHLAIANRPNFDHDFVLRMARRR